MKRNLLIFLVVSTLVLIGITNPTSWSQETDLSEMKNKAEIQKVVQLRIKIKTERDEKIVKRLGLECELGENEVICKTTIAQMSELKNHSIEFEVQKEGIRVERKHSEYKRVIKGKGNVYGENPSNYSIPQGSWTYSSITIASAPAGATVTTIDVYYEVIHTYVGDLLIKLTDQDWEHEWTLWYYEGGSGDNIQEAEFDITAFYGELANQTWKLRGYDCCPGDDGYIDYWSIQIWYELLPDLIVQSLTATNYNPEVGDSIDVTMVIKNQGAVAASGWFYNGLFYNLSSPPDINTTENRWWSTYNLDPGQTDSWTFSNITSSEPGTWHTYGLADCDGNVIEGNESNNYKGPVDINWTSPPPDLVVQSLIPTNHYPPITEHVNVTLTIKNQSSYPVLDSFYTDFYKNKSSTPPIPSTGEEFCYWKSGPLSPGETKTYTFYKLPTDYYTNTWRMWGVVDSRPNSWGNIQESNENNNKLSEYLYWSDAPSPDNVTRDQIMQHAQEYDNIAWYCYPWYTWAVSQCPSWSSDYTPYQWYYGEAYCWGGWDKCEDFSDYLYYGLLRPGSHDENDCITGGGDPYWATGTDCSGFVSRCWELGQKHSCSMLASASISTQISDNSLLPGDILNKTSAPAHVMLFYQWVDAGCETLLVYEARSYGVGRDSNVVDINRYRIDSLLNVGYVPRRFNYVEEPGQHDPVITGHLHCKYPQDECVICFHHEEERTIEINAYDPDGDPIYYVWWCSYGYFIVGGYPVPACTTQENYVIYQAPIWLYNQDHLFVDVHDNRGGHSDTDGVVEVFDPGYSCRCGDVKGDDGQVGLGDVTVLISYLYKGGPRPPDPIERADVNNDCVIDVADLVYLISYLYKGGSPPECCWIH